jgi:hypothetical protein
MHQEAAGWCWWWKFNGVGFDSKPWGRGDGQVPLDEGKEGISASVAFAEVGGTGRAAANEVEEAAARIRRQWAEVGDNPRWVGVGLKLGQRPLRAASFWRKLKGNEAGHKEVPGQNEILRRMGCRNWFQILFKDLDSNQIDSNISKPKFELDSKIE